MVSVQHLQQPVWSCYALSCLRKESEELVVFSSILMHLSRSLVLHFDAQPIVKEHDAVKLPEYSYSGVSQCVELSEDFHLRLFKDTNKSRKACGVGPKKFQVVMP